MGVPLQHIPVAAFWDLISYIWGRVPLWANTPEVRWAPEASLLSNTLLLPKGAWTQCYIPLLSPTPFPFHHPTIISTVYEDLFVFTGLRNVKGWHKRAPGMWGDLLTSQPWKTCPPLNLQLLLAVQRRKSYFLEPLWEPKPRANSRSKVSKPSGDVITFPNQVLEVGLWLPTFLAWGHTFQSSPHPSAPSPHLPNQKLVNCFPVLLFQFQGPLCVLNFKESLFQWVQCCDKWKLQRALLKMVWLKWMVLGLSPPPCPPPPPTFLSNEIAFVSGLSCLISILKIFKDEKQNSHTIFKMWNDYKMAPSQCLWIIEYDHKIIKNNHQKVNKLPGLLLIFT